MWRPSQNYAGNSMTSSVTGQFFETPPTEGRVMNELTANEGLRITLLVLPQSSSYYGFTMTPRTNSSEKNLL